MHITQQPAFVLHSRAWRETSLLLEVFSRDYGRVGLLARSVRGARARLPRALLEPLQALRVDWGGRGELQTLAAVEPDGPAVALRGDALLSALYVNELLVRLTARNDPHPGLFERYAMLLDELACTPMLGWSLRCFERDLLAAMGYAPQLEVDSGTGEPIDPAREYEYLPEQGPVAAQTQVTHLRVRGSALLALASGMPPETGDQAALRRLMRALLGVHLGDRGLQAWRVLAGPLAGKGRQDL
jgi:DNA repair protein RecO (recombination protein O)